MIGLDNDCFPRGNRTVNKEEPVKRKFDDNLFTIGKQPKVKKIRKEKPVEEEIPKDQPWHAALKLQGTLTYNKIQSGMLILGCIKRITNLSLQIELPGLTHTIITINQISDKFTEILKEKLEEETEEPGSLLKQIFEVGQLVPVKVLDNIASDEGHKVLASINPKDVNAEMTHSSFTKGSTVWGYVQSELDHGYEIALGVKNTRTFLPFKSTDKKYQIGQPLFCIVHKIEQSTAATLTVSAKKQHLNTVQISNGAYLQNIIPGTKVDFLIEEILSDGIKGTFLQNCFGYLDQSHYFSKNSPKSLKVANSLQLYVLFVDPITKITYMTARGLEIVPLGRLEIGTNKKCEIVLIRPGGVVVRLENELGFVSNKRLIRSLPKQVGIEMLRNHYPVKSKHSCRILDFNRLEQLYICTFEKDLLKENCLTVKNLTLGQILSVKIDKVLENGLVVSTGLIHGFVPNLQLSNSQFSRNIKNKFLVGNKVTAKVLKLTEEGNVIFTIKKGLIESDNCLGSADEVQANVAYTGVVVLTKTNGALVAFYGDKTGWLPSKGLNSGVSADPSEYFFVGQVINVFVVDVGEDKRFTLSLTPKCLQVNKKSNKKLKVGFGYRGKVSEINDNELLVQVEPVNIEAVVPFAHLHENLEIGKTLLKTYKIGDFIPDLICMTNKGKPIMSRREYSIYYPNGVKVLKLNNLEKGMIIRCSYESENTSGINVTTLLDDFHDEICITKKNLPKLYTFIKHELILAQILDIDHETKSITLKVKELETPESSLEEIILQLESILNERKRIIERCQKQKSSIMKYKIGERVNCVVNKLNLDGSCCVLLPNGAKGFSKASLSQPKLVKKQKVEGVVLNYNFIEERLEMCLKNTIKQKVNPAQNGIIDKSTNDSVLVDFLLHTKLYALGVIRDKKCNRQLIHVPIEYAEKEESSKVKIRIARKWNNLIIGVPKKMLNGKIIQKKKNTKQVTKSVETSQEVDLVMDIDEIEVSEDEMEKSVIIPNKINKQTPEIEIKEEVEMKTEVEETPLAILPGISSFYTTEDPVKSEDSSSDEDEANEEEKNKRKKKLTPAERAEMLRLEEERITKIEKELADSSTAPQSAEQFDRLLLANPNSSELWLRYIAMHVATTELEKARAVGRRALDTINMTFVKEKFNVWLALLNLENMYGTKDSFEKLFEDAVKYNDSLDIYLSVIKMLAQAGKISEMEEKIKKIRMKEKQNTKMWLEIGLVYYSLQDFKSARNIKEAALRSILDPKRQFDLMLKFGIMEFQHGELEQAVANFETILETYPSKINIWIIYVDQLVKREKIDMARKLLEKAVGEKFPLKSMKAIFHKYLSFEEKYGTEELVQSVKKRAEEYVQSVR